VSPDIHVLTGAYATHSIPDGEQREFRDHLATCGRCTGEMRELEATTARLGAALATSPPLRLKAQVMAAIDQIRQLPPIEHIPWHTWRGRHPRRWVRVLAAAASVVLLVAVAVLGTNNVSLRDQVDGLRAQRETVQQILTASDATVVTAEAHGRSGRVVVAPSREAGVFFATGLAPAPEGQTYQGWLVNSETDIRSAGLFQPGADGSAVLLVTGDLLAAQAFAVTLEPAGGSPQPTALPPLLAVPL
jgi:anti-sigma-K factor RskA